MKSILRWSIRNSPAMNTLLIGIVVVGLLSLFRMRREVFPEFNLDMILITVPYPGASPTEVEEGICQKIEASRRTRGLGRFHRARHRPPSRPLLPPMPSPQRRIVTRWEERPTRRS
ncbi:MAG: efflux RND transporter permease subunit, partial [Thermogutta sp.]|uniref:efflux RND transporter permease subunit n=1 Tax=Thermogutta sp. TaxID=1962930 RepID=UPI00198886F4